MMSARGRAVPQVDIEKEVLSKIQCLEDVENYIAETDTYIQTTWDVIKQAAEMLPTERTEMFNLLKQTHDVFTRKKAMWSVTERKKEHFTSELMKKALQQAKEINVLCSVMLNVRNQLWCEKQFLETKVIDGEAVNSNLGNIPKIQNFCRNFEMQSQKIWDSSRRMETESKAWNHIEMPKKFLALSVAGAGESYITKLEIEGSRLSGLIKGPPREPEYLPGLPPPSFWQGQGGGHGGVWNGRPEAMPWEFGGRDWRDNERAWLPPAKRIRGGVGGDTGPPQGGDGGGYSGGPTPLLQTPSYSPYGPYGTGVPPRGPPPYQQQRNFHPPPLSQGVLRANKPSMGETQDKTETSVIPPLLPYEPKRGPTTPPDLVSYPPPRSLMDISPMSVPPRLLPGASYQTHF